MSTVLKGEFKLKENTDKKQMEIEGFANKAVTDRVGDLIPKEAWELDNFIKNPIIFFNHDSEHPIGKAIKVEPHEDGLKIKIRLSRTKEGKVPYVRDLISEGILRSFSVGFDDHGSSQKNADGINVIKRAELIETSVVSVPMNQDSLFTVVGGGEKSGKRTYTKQAYNCKSHNYAECITYEQLKEQVLSEKGAWVAAALQNAVYELQDNGTAREVTLGRIMESLDLTREELDQIMAGNVTPVPEEFLTGAAEILGLDLESLQELNQADLDVGEKDPEDSEEIEQEADVPEDVQDEVDENKAESDEDSNEEEKEDVNKDFQDCVSSKIPKLLEEGLDRDQAIAQAISSCESDGKCVASAADLKTAIVNYNTSEVSTEKAVDPEAPPIPLGEPSTARDEFDQGQPAIELAKSQLVMLGMIAQTQKDVLAELQKLTDILGPTKAPEPEVSETPEADEPKAMDEEDEEDQATSGKMLQIQKDMLSISSSQKALDKLLSSF